MYLLFSMGYILRAGACIRDTYKRTDIQKGHVMIPITFILPVDAIPSLPDAPYVCILEYSYTPWFEQQNVEGAWVGENETKLKKKKKGIGTRIRKEGRQKEGGEGEDRGIYIVDNIKIFELIRKNK